MLTIASKNIKASTRDLMFLNSHRAVSAQLRTAMEEGLTTQQAALQFIGKRFRVKLELGDWVPDELVTMEMLRYACIICVECGLYLYHRNCMCVCVRVCVRVCQCVISF